MNSTISSRCTTRAFDPRVISCLLALIFTAYVASPCWSATPQHPLDALTADELWGVYEAIKNSEYTNEKTRFVRVGLIEPAKANVLSWRPGQPFGRQAMVILAEGPKVFEATIDVTKKKITMWVEVKGVQVPYSNEEFEEADPKTKENPEWQAAMKKRGITDFDSVTCLPLSWHDIGPTTAETRRYVRVITFSRLGGSNFWGRVVGGLVVVFDLIERKVVEVIDTGISPMSDVPVDYDTQSVDSPRDVPSTISVTQPKGPGFQLDGHVVTWQKWKFHFRVEPRLGVVVSDVSYNDGGRPRRILYQMNLAEIFVPYMDPHLDFSGRAYLDLSENPGSFATYMVPGEDCPEYATLFDAVVSDANGMPEKIPNAAALYELYDGTMAWRHKHFFSAQSESRRNRKLVLRMITTLGNYDYILDWIFGQDGAITVKIGATGIDLVKTVKGRTIVEGKNDPNTKYGRYVAPHILAVNHDHYYCFRLDLDVDGVNNSFMRERLKVVDVPNGGTRKTMWVHDPQIAKTESEAKMRINMAKPALWRVINPKVKNRVGYPVSYHIKPHGGGRSLVPTAHYPHHRGGFINYHLWVTPHDPDELYPGGTYPLSSKPHGLPAWTSANRPIENTDIVAWYVVGFHHVVRAEDWPLMPSAWHSFEIRPFDFFEGNPALDLPKGR